MNNSSVFDLDRRNKRSRYTTLPDVCYLDTSFVLSAIEGNSNKYSSSLCKDFITELTNAGSMMVVSPTVFEEVAHVIRRKCVQDAAGNQDMREKDIDLYICHNPTVLTVINQRVKQLWQILETICYRIDFHSDKAFLNEVIQVMSQFGLGVNDAKHIALCLREGINCIATDDGDFQKTDGFNIYTPNSKLVNTCATRANVYINQSSTFKTP
ncbi:MAG: type II toxin-antitoxin system VapC family toxin [Petrimonas sp.]|nr:type II toxin-antitoxin system VapC family toxin [Christensenella sp.]MEA4948413.1 type II toxin-antitoxin system VapC family toxin [Petrimonas sp.]